MLMCDNVRSFDPAGEGAMLVGCISRLQVVLQQKAGLPTDIILGVEGRLFGGFLRSPVTSLLGARGLDGLQRRRGDIITCAVGTGHRCSPRSIRTPAGECSPVT